MSDIQIIIQQISKKIVSSNILSHSILIIFKFKLPKSKTTKNKQRKQTFFKFKINKLN